MNINLDKQTFSKPTLIVVEQKGSDEIECRERFMAGCAVFELLRAFSDNCHFMIVGGANNGVQPETIREWCPEAYFKQLVISNKAGNTNEKGVAIAAYVKEKNITNIIQVTSLYHSLRAYLTTLQSLRTANLEVTLFNHVCDSEDAAAIRFALLDEMLLSRGAEPQPAFSVSVNTYETYLSAAASMQFTAGLEKFLVKRYGESRRIAEYSERGKGHLVTSIAPDDILSTYLLG